ncbi:hypothetical protein SAMN02949497_0469 [Methylomagnum ishizawai]|uniref:Uncharacterized protein n=1 Tax=Methylomagnum ishizawai TaxID=1760988 RepID=A0A1Y6D4U1_9GAMM|nr:hypothetical protein [Methylomagnum ishizawai]SMF97440.1 hypothetical protein SAMN02949497_0469 [Methylomagnum ishizawai]
MRGIIVQAGSVLLLGSIASVGFAGGRYANPPVGLVEVQQSCTKALEAAQKGDTAAALESAKAARKTAVASYKEISTMPMEVGSSTTKKAIAALEANNTAEAITELQHCKEKLDSEVDYYKKEGKL